MGELVQQQWDQRPERSGYIHVESILNSLVVCGSLGTIAREFNKGQQERVWRWQELRGGGHGLLEAERSF